MTQYIGNLNFGGDNGVQLDELVTIDDEAAARDWLAAGYISPVDEDGNRVVAAEPAPAAEAAPQAAQAPPAPVVQRPDAAQA